MADSTYAPLASEAGLAAAEPKVTQVQMTLNLIAAGLGTGMFSLPSAMAGSSVVLGVAMTFGVVFLNAFTIMILIWAAEDRQVFDLGNLVALLPGPLLPGACGRKLPSLGSFMKAFVNGMVWVALLGSLVSYIIVMHDSTRPFVRGTVLDHGRFPLVTLSALVVLALCFLDQRHLSWTSTVCVLVNVYLLVILCLYFSERAVEDTLPGDTCLLGLGKGSASMLSVLAQCIILQMCAPPMYEELENRTPKRFAQCLWTAFGVLGFIFSVFAGLGYMVFGPGVDGNILLSFPAGLLSDFAQLGTVLVVAAIYPLMVIPMVAPVKNAALPERLARHKGSIVLATTVGITVVAYLGALLIGNLLTINVLDGALCVTAFTALAPGLVGLYMLGKPSPAWRALMVFLFVFGVSNTVLGLVMHDPYVAELQAHCIWWTF